MFHVMPTDIEQGHTMGKQSTGKGLDMGKGCKQIGTSKTCLHNTNYLAYVCTVAIMQKLFHDCTDLKKKRFIPHKGTHFPIIWYHCICHIKMKSFFSAQLFLVKMMVIKCLLFRKCRKARKKKESSSLPLYFHIL